MNKKHKSFSFEELIMINKILSDSNGQDVSKLDIYDLNWEEFQMNRLKGMVRKQSKNIDKYSDKEISILLKILDKI